MYEPDADMIFNYLMVSALANSTDIIEKKNLKATGGWYFFAIESALSHPAKMDLNKKRIPKQKTIQNFNIDAQGLRKTRNENLLTLKIGVTS